MTNKLINQSIRQIRKHLRKHPGAMYITEDGTQAYVLDPNDNKTIWVLDGDFSGDADACNLELQRIIEAAQK